MRTTLDIDDQVLAAARTLAAETRVSIGTALSELARRGLRAAEGDETDGVPTFAVGDGIDPLTPEMVAEANEDA